MMMIMIKSDKSLFVLHKSTTTVIKSDKSLFVLHKSTTTVIKSDKSLVVLHKSTTTVNSMLVTRMLLMMIKMIKQTSEGRDIREGEAGRRH